MMILRESPKTIKQIAVSVFCSVLILLSLVSSVLIYSNRANAAPPTAPTNIRIVSQTATSAVFAWDAYTGAIPSMTTYDYKLAYGDTIIAPLYGTIPETTIELTFPTDGMDYTFSVATFDNSIPAIGARSAITFSTPTGSAAQITGISFVQEGSKKLMKVVGTDIADPALFARSLGSLNGEVLPVCLEPISSYGQSLAFWISTYNTTADAITDTPNCVRFANESSIVVFTPTAVEVWLTDDFDIEAPGTLVINRSAPFSFNTVTTPVADPPVEEPEVEAPPKSDPKPAVKPTKPAAPVPTPAETPSTSEVVINADAKTVIGQPTISKKPTFSGTAAPLSTVTVTVHSDPVTCTTTADANGYWTCTLSEDLPVGAHQVFVKVQSTSNEVIELGPYDVIVKQDTPGVVTSETQTDQPAETRASFPWVWVGLGAGALIVIAIAILAVRRTVK